MEFGEQHVGRLVMVSRWTTPDMDMRRSITAGRASILRGAALSGAVLSTNGGLVYVVEGAIGRVWGLRSVVQSSPCERLDPLLLLDEGTTLGFSPSWPRTPCLTHMERLWLEMLLENKAPVGAVIALAHWAACRAAEKMTEATLFAGADDTDTFPPARRVH